MERINNAAIDSNSLRVQVFREIEKAILDGVYSPGDSLIEMKLSTELGVSRTPVREALRQLELENLVKTVPNKGAVVIGVSEKDILDIYDIRVVLECLASRWAADNITDEELSELCEVVELQEYYAKKGDNLQVWHLDTKFHEIIYNSSRSRPLRHTLSNFHHYIQKAREVSFKTSGRAESAAHEHRNIYEALKQHNADTSSKLTEDHIRFARENFIKNTKE